MTDNPKSALCLSEINVGLPLPVAYNRMCKDTLNAKAFREMALGAQWNSERALKGDVIDDSYSG